MKHLGFVLGAIILFALSTGAQINSGTPATSMSTTQDAVQNTAALAPAANTLYAAALTPATPSSPLAQPAQPDPAPASLVQGVFQTYNLQAYVGYTFFRMYLDPKLTNNMNGLNLGLDYYPGGGWIGVDGSSSARSVRLRLAPQSSSWRRAARGSAGLGRGVSRFGPTA